MSSPSMSRRYDFVQVDVFTDQAFGGNQLAVFLDGRGLSSGEMQTLAREMNFSESTFVLPSDLPEAARRVRIFTPAEELPMAGHPTVGTAWVLAARGDLPLTGDTTGATLALEIGPVPMQIESEGGQPSFVWMSHRQPEFGPVRSDAEAVAEALGATAADLRNDLPIQVVSTGLPYLFVPFRSLEAIGRCRPNQAALAGLYPGETPLAVYLFTMETTTPEALVHGRMFAPHVFDIPEDPATGSAAAPLAAYLAGYGLAPGGPEARFVCEQGIEMGRPSRIHLEVRRQGEEIVGLRIGGQAVIVGAGAIFWEASARPGGSSMPRLVV
jgi:trans-2,3-dihydro-3-hydroxyanthranilate isomerase